MRPSSPRRVRAASFCNPGRWTLSSTAPCLRPRASASEQCEALRGGGRDRLLGIDVLAGGDRLGENVDALLGRGRIEEDRQGGVRERGVEIRGPFRDVVGVRDRGKTIVVAADQQQAGDQAVIVQYEAAFTDDRDQGVGQMLRRADAAGGAVDDDPDSCVAIVPSVRAEER